MLFAFAWCVTELAMLCVQSRVNLIIQPPHGAAGRSAHCPALHQSTCYWDVFQATKQIYNAPVFAAACAIIIHLPFL